jgi:hypothetical protein
MAFVGLAEAAAAYGNRWRASLAERDELVSEPAQRFMPPRVPADLTLRGRGAAGSRWAHHSGCMRALEGMTRTLLAATDSPQRSAHVYCRCEAPIADSIA